MCCVLCVVCCVLCVVCCVLCVVCCVSVLWVVCCVLWVVGCGVAGWVGGWWCVWRKMWSIARVSSHTYKHAMNLKMGQHQCTSPFGRTDQSENPTPVPSKGRFQASPVQTSSNPKARKKIARHARLTSPLQRKKGAQSFPSPGSGMTSEHAPGRVFLVNRTRFPKLPLQSRRSPEVTALLLPTHFPNRGKTQGGNCLVKKSGTEPELQGSIKKLRC